MAPTAEARGQPGAVDEAALRTLAEELSALHGCHAVVPDVVAAHEPHESVTGDRRMLHDFVLAVTHRARDRLGVSFDDGCADDGQR